jgi:6-phosphogluconolactonase (cycloisomerase 2 family)
LTSLRQVVGSTIISYITSSRSHALGVISRAEKADQICSVSDYVWALKIPPSPSYSPSSYSANKLSSPRTFDIKKTGDFIVIGDQTSANVVIVKRDPATGLLGPQLASLGVGIVGTAEEDNGLSAVL